MKEIFTFMICLISFNLAAQKSEDIYKVKNGTNISTVIPFKERYYFNEFHEGKVYFRNGKTTKAKLNYSLFHGEIQFIGPKKDTLLFNDNDFINRIVIENEIFYYAQNYGHIRQIQDFGKVMLGEKQSLLSMGNEKFTANNQYTAGSATYNYSSFVNKNGEFQWIQPSEKIILRKMLTYLWIDRNQKFYKANKANLIKIYPDFKRVLNDFIKDNDTNFENKEDLIKVLEFCNSL